MNYLNENASSFLQQHIAEIIKKYKYEDMIKNRFDYMWLMQDQPQEAVQSAQKDKDKQKKFNQYLSAGWVAAAFWAKGIFEQWNAQDDVSQQNRMFFIVAMGVFTIINCIYLVVNYAIKKPFRYQQIAYYLSVDYLIISELQNQKEIKTNFIKVADMSATKIETNYLAVYLDNLNPLLVYGVGLENLQIFIEKHLEK
jgi:hypothetical protein